MNSGIIIVTFTILSFLTIFLLAYQKQVNDILNRLDESKKRTFLNGADIIEVLKVYRKKEKLSETERRLFKTVLILSSISFVLFAVFVFFVFGTDW
jgi:amino acid permease